MDRLAGLRLAVALLPGPDAADAIRHGALAIACDRPAMARQAEVWRQTAHGESAASSVAYRRGDDEARLEAETRRDAYRAAASWADRRAALG